jgi:phosphoribosylanthranilate isomerase/ribosomal protein S18 acetylase RimI-like enzyme
LKKRYPKIKLVGVFVNTPIDEIEDILDSCSLDLAQLHGDELPDVLAQLSPRAFKAFRGIPADVSAYQRDDAPAFLVDAAVKGVYGGSGVRADWSGAAELAGRYPIFLAGGLNPENVAEAVRKVRPWGVDVASGVEVPPLSGGKAALGEKDAAKMRTFVKAVRAENSGETESYSVQNAEMDDLEEILVLQKLAYQSEAQLNNDFTIPPLRQTLDEIHAEFEQTIFLKVEQDGRIVGSVRAREKDGSCYIGRLIVHPAYQNRGIGSHLLEAIEHMSNIRRFELFTSLRSERNLYLYTKFGYREFKQAALNEQTTLVFLEKVNGNYTS